MRVLLLDQEKITKITLPNEIDGVFLMSYNPIGSKISKELSIEAKDDKWILKSNGSINVLLDNHITDEIVLENYLHTKVSIVGKDDILDLYCLPTIEENKYKLAVNTNEITIGKNNQCSIIYNNADLQDVHAGIYNQADKWYIAIPENSTNCFVYLNDNSVTSRKEIKIGDVIFIHGLKIIWMGKFIQINNPQDKVVVNTRIMSNYIEPEYDNTKFDPVSEEDQGIELYKAEDYFFHTPSLREYVVDEEITIDAPPPKQYNDDENFLATFGASFTMMASSFVTGLNAINNIINNGRLISIITSCVMCVSMLIGSLLIPKIAGALQKKKNKRRERLRIVKYSAYINSRDEEIKRIMVKQQQVLRESNKDINECLALVNSKNTNMLWNREVKDEDFLIIRMGMGNVPAKVKINAPQETFTLDDDDLLQMVYDVENKNRVLENVPVTFNFLKNRVSALISDVNYGDHFINSIILQIAALHSAQDLKLVFFMNDDDNERWEFAKFLPHCFSEDKTIRYYAETYDEMKIVSTNLETIFKDRKSTIKSENNEINEDSKTYRQFDTYYLIITNDIMNAKNLPIVDMALESTENLGFSVLMIDKNMNQLPKRCNSFIALSQDSGCVMEKNLNSQILFAPEFNSQIDMKSAAEKLLNIPLMPSDIQSALPTSISFLEMYGVSKIEQLNISNRWKTNDPTMSLAAPIGVHTSGELFTLDLHEKVAGPHGLIAGSTGSGKSEFIITYVLSMALNYHPDEVQFVLIDYKGGGLAGAFENREKGTGIPHIAGTITNLDTSSMNRSLVSINSELKRREHMFNEARNVTGESTIDIYKYQKYYREGIIKEPMSHLFIISDEFAELKSQQPEFMQELISTARIGRSLGVHLILATQKPSGVVNEQIWSNSRFRVCLKVQTTGDSQEMLKKPVAASIKEAGRFYLQVGYDEYFDIGQSGWAGAKYVPTDRIIKKVDDSICFINNVGTITKNVNTFVKKETTEELGDQLTNIVNYLDQLGKKDDHKPQRLWLDPIPSTLYIANLAQKYNYKAEKHKIKPIIGEYDIPQKQFQGLLTLDMNNGNTYIFGKNGSGKEDLLSTIIYSSCINHSPDEIAYYIVDMGAETLRSFIKFPHVADVCTVDDKDKILDLMVMIEKEIETRKDLTVDFGGSFESYNEMNEKKLPLICVIINNLDIFVENYAKIAELIIPLYRDGAKYGVTFMVTATSVNTLRQRTRDYFDNHLCLQMANSDDYTALLNKCPRKLNPADYKGRGLIEYESGVYEFQSALIYTKNEIPATIKETAESLIKKYPDSKLAAIPSIPQIVNVDSMLDFVEGFDNVPLGYNIENKERFFYNFKAHKVNLISAVTFEPHISFLNALMLELKRIKDIDIKVVDFSGYFDILTIGLTCYQNNFNDVFGHIIEESQKLEKQTLYVITGISKLKASVDPANIKFINKFLEDTQNNPKINFIFIDTKDELNELKIEDWYQKIVDTKYGLWLGQDVGSQLIINFNSLSIEDKRINSPDICFVAKDGKRYLVKKVVMKEDEEDGQ